MSNPSIRCSRRSLILAAGSTAFCSWAGARPGPAASATDSSTPPLLASVYTGQIDPALCLVSDKYDGVRAVWDGRVLRHRSGREVWAPRSFLASLPGELPRPHFERTAALCDLPAALRRRVVTIVSAGRE
jgi:hypothetical protein